MSDQLTSVRFAQETIEDLKLLAELNDGSVAAEIRTAVDKHIRAVTSDPEFASKLAAKEEERRRRTDSRIAALASAARVDSAEDGS